MQTLDLQQPVSRPYGQRVGNLTRFGETWLNLEEISAIEFGPEDGCGCEIGFRNQEECWHVPLEDADCLRLYLTGFESIERRVDESQGFAAGQRRLGDGLAKASTLCPA
jgi:hypothetical protein